MTNIKRICARLIELWDADCDIDIEINELRSLLADAELQVGVTLVIPEMTDTIERAIEQRKPEPIPVAERLPGAEDCDAEGMCWWYCAPAERWLRCGIPEPDPASQVHTHWLPANALPLPKEVV